MVSKGIILPKLPFLAFPIVSILVFVPLVPAFALEQNGVIEMPFSENKPSVDGKWTTSDEWADASKTTIGSGNNVMILLVKHDRDYLYVMGDMVREFSDENKVLSMVFDTNNNGGNEPDSEDIMATLPHKGTRLIEGGWCVECYSEIDGQKIPYRGFGGMSEIPGTIAATSLSTVNDQFESTLPHRIIEFKIPLSFLYKNDKYGFAISYSPYHEGAWKDQYVSKDIILWPNTVKPTWPVFAVPDDYGVLMDPTNQVTIPPIPVISLSTTTLSFGNEEISGKSSPKTITISNQGTSILKISNVRASGEFSIPDLKTPMEIQPSQSVSLNVVFAPITIGEKSGTVMISSNDLSKPTMTIEITGKGVEKGKSPFGGGCLIATATYGSELASQVQLLREVRDNILFGTNSGASFMAAFNWFYYSFSPTIADWERQNPAFKETVKIAITPMLSTLSILNYVPIDSEQEILGYGIGIILLNIGMYFVVPAIIISKLKFFKSRS